MLIKISTYIFNFRNISFKLIFNFNKYIVNNNKRKGYLIEVFLFLVITTCEIFEFCQKET